MKNLLSEFEQAQNKRSSIISNQSSYKYTVKTPYQQVTKSYQNCNQTIRLSYSEMPAHWWVDLYGTTRVYGINTPGRGFKNFFPEGHILEELKQKIIAKTGATNVVVPSQQVLILGGQQVIYQVDENGSYGHVQGTWHPNPEGITGSVRFFYKMTKEIQTVNTHYRDEARFDAERYNRDLARAEQDILRCQNNIQKLISQAQAELNTIKSTTSSTEVSIASLQNKLNNFNKEFQNRENRKKSLEKNISTEHNVSTSLQQQISSLKHDIKENEGILEQKKEQFYLITEELTESQALFKSNLESLTAQQRAFIFAETFDDPSKNFIIKILSSMSLDYEALGFYAIKKDHKALIEIVLEHEVDFGSYHYDGKSLLQHLIKAGNEDLIDFVLSIEDQDFATTLLTAIDQDDVETLKVILSHNPHLLSSLHDNGYSLLHVAVSLNKIDAIKTFLNIDNTIVDIKSTNLESAFAVALRQSNLEVTKLLLEHINFENEINDLINRGNNTLIEALKAMDIQLENSNKLIIEQALAGEEMNDLAYQVGNIDLIGDIDNWMI